MERALAPTERSRLSHRGPLITLPETTFLTQPSVSRNFAKSERRSVPLLSARHDKRPAMRSISLQPLGELSS